MFKKFLILPVWILLAALLLLTLIPLWAVLHAKPSSPAQQRQIQQKAHVLETPGDVIASVTATEPTTTPTPAATATGDSNTPTPTSGFDPTATVVPTATSGLPPTPIPTATPTATPATKAVITLDHPPVYGYNTTGSGSGFKPGETVNLLWDYGQPGQFLIKTETVDSWGSFSFAFYAPSGPGPGNFEFAAVGMQSGIVAVTDTYERAYAYFKPITANPGQQLQVTGAAFGASESVTLFFEDSAGTTTLTSAQTNALGTFTASFVVPTTSSPGNTTILFVGNSSKINVSINCPYTPSLTLTPNTGNNGTVVTVHGYNFTAYGAISVYWVDPRVGGGLYLATITMNGSGIATGTITVPDPLISGHTYYVEAQDNHTGFFAQASFIAS